MRGLWMSFVIDWFGWGGGGLDWIDGWLRLEMLKNATLFLLP